MAPRSPRISEPEASDLARSPVKAGRLGIYTAIGASAGAVPLPWVPDALARRVRGALVHDVAARHGLALEPEAREALAAPGGTSGSSGVVAQAVRFVGVKVAMRTLSALGPVRLLSPFRAGLQMYVLGYLFDRYLRRRSSGSATDVAAPIGAIEARRVRAAIDGALSRALTIEIDPPADSTRLTGAGGETRDRTTVYIDNLLGLAAGVPERLMRRLETAFDDILGDSLASSNVRVSG